MEKFNDLENNRLDGWEASYYLKALQSTHASTNIRQIFNKKNCIVITVSQIIDNIATACEWLGHHSWSITEFEVQFCSIYITLKSFLRKYTTVVITAFSYGSW